MLVQKQPEGTYGITEYGKLMLQLSSSMEFNEKLLKGVKFKDLFPESELVALKISSEKQINVEGRGLPLSDIPAMIMLTEKEGAICLRFIGGRMDYSCFACKDSPFLNWVKDLFLYYWDKAKRA